MNPEPSPQNQSNITWHEGEITHQDREKVLGQRGCVLWFTGLSGSGKSTIARALEEALIKAGHATYVLDGDNVRHGLNADLDFSPESRTENIRRMGEVAALFADAGLITITAFISPYKKDRDQVRKIIAHTHPNPLPKINDQRPTTNDQQPTTSDQRPMTNDQRPMTSDQRPKTKFFEIYINTPLEVCEARDPKSLYTKARAGEIKDFTGISAPFEAPQSPEIEILTDQHSVQECADQILQQLKAANILQKT